MPLAAADLIAPNGPIGPTLFPGEGSNELAARIDGYLASAYADSRVTALDNDGTRDRGARALALYTAFTDVYIRMSAEPLTVNIAEKGSHGYSAAQLQNMKNLAAGFLAELEDLIPIETADVVVRGTKSVKNVFVF